MCMCRKRKSSNQTCCLTPENPSTMAVRIETSVPPLWGTRTMASTCSFVPCADHPELFQALYQRYRTFQARLMLFRFIFSSFLVARTNRTRGSKILRCFPHCCPGHMGRSFCGSSLRLRVDTQVPSELLVFARFRLAKARDFAVGDCISASDVLAPLQSEQNPNGEWITAHEHVELAQRHSRCFLLNPSARWFYSWESGVAKSHRLQEHILSILVVAPIRASTQEGNPMWLRVVATTASPPFKLISFRRATAAAITAIEEMPSPVGQAKMSAAPAQLTKPADMAGESTLRGVLLPSLPAMTRQARTQELVFLFSAVEQIQARDILGCADKIFKIYDATLDFQTNMSLTGSSCLRKWLELLVLTGNEERCRHEAWTSSSLVVTLSLVAAWCSFDVEFNRTVHQFVRVGSKQVLNRDALHAVFEELVSWVWVKLDDICAVSTGHSPPCCRS